MLLPTKSSMARRLFSHVLAEEIKVLIRLDRISWHLHVGSLGSKIKVHDLGSLGYTYFTYGYVYLLLFFQSLFCK